MQTTQNKTVSPRMVPSRDERYMGLAFWLASFSKDPSTQVGAVIVSSQNVPLGTGYNGPPREISDIQMNWSRPEKYDYIVHAEENAIDHSLSCVHGATLYVTAKPCKRCMLRIVNVRIKRVVWFPHKSVDPNSMFSNGDIGDKTDEIARFGSVMLEKFSGNLNWMRDRMSFMQLMGIFA